MYNYYLKIVVIRVGSERFELPWAVLETAVLTWLYYNPAIAKEALCN